MEVWRFDTTDPALGALLEGRHDPGLVVLSIFIACFAGLTALTLSDRMLASFPLRARAGWHLGGALAMGCGIWAMHFTGMLAFSVGGHEAMEHALGLTVLSLLPAILGSGAALHCMGQPRVGRRELLQGGLLLALGIGGMHYLGMEAMQMPGLRYDPWLFLLSLLVAFLLALAALSMHFRVRQPMASPASGVALRLLAGVFMGFAVAGMHYTAMAAARFYEVEFPGMHGGPRLSRLALAMAVASFAGLVLGLGLLAAWVDRQKSVQRMLEGLANTDTLTGLPNRLHLRRHLEGALAESRHQDTRLAVFFLDLNDFKVINDSMGHAEGDKVLRAFADRLMSAVRQDDTVARFGGDEFVIIVRGLASVEAAAHAAERLLHAMEPPFEFGDWKLCARASIGISLFPDDGFASDELIQQADAAMYRAKQEALGYHFYDRTLTDHAMQRVRLGSDLREALQREGLFLHYQLQVSLSSGHCTGVEALVRWEHPREGYVSPAVFVPLAERTGLIQTFGEWVLRSACRQGRCWLDDGLEFGRIAVNIAAPHLSRADFVVRLRQILDETGLPTRCLELELTESSLMPLEPETLSRLQEIRALGVSLAVDDFGTGYSSLRYLKELPVDKLKLDRAFVRDAVRDSRDRAIIRAVIALGAELGFDVLVEGLESADQVDCIRAQGGRLGQGFHFARPAAAADIVGYLRGVEAAGVARRQ